jgi:hypothetical protein
MECRLATYPITDDVLLSPEAEAYFTNADRRVRTGLRATLAMLGLPLPAYARRVAPGVPAARAVIAAHRADNPHALPSFALPSRKPNASAATIAAARQRSPINPA